MGAEAEVVCQQSVPVLEVQYFAKGNNVYEVVEDVVAVPQSLSPKSFDKFHASDLVSVDLTSSQEVNTLVFLI